MDQHGRDRTVKWVIILAAIVVIVLLYGAWSDWFGLTANERATDPGPDRPEASSSAPSEP
ncbi:hypothetical protein [Mangrovicella endophytica]|uniref:hypothetical protein n=1 Tax=Mangrovicella endophytica TaxID=2066697 RepID=UPI000C9DD795|nr:hypothetical protein [Mangrovicella endophytica]